LLRIASIFLSLGIALLLSAGYIASPLALFSKAEDELELATIIPPCWTNRLFWGTFLGVCAINWGLSLLHTPVFLPRVGVHVVAYLGLLVGLGMVFAGLAMWDALS
jgi:short subunit fatty acids transporter